MHTHFNPPGIVVVVATKESKLIKIVGRIPAGEWVHASEGMHGRALVYGKVCGVVCGVVVRQQLSGRS